MKYYLHRISHHAEWSWPLLEERQLLSIGWAEFGSQSGFLPQHQDDWSRVPETIEGAHGKWKTRFGLQRFLEMEQGDRVVVPAWGAFHVYEVADNERLVPAQVGDLVTNLEKWKENNAAIRDGYLTEQNEEGSKKIDLGFFRRVTPIARDIPRGGYADAALTRRMKVRQANVEVTDLHKNIEEAIVAYEKKRPINLRCLVLDGCAGIVRDTILSKQDPEKFEKLIQSYLEHQGASTEIPAKNERDKDGDADVIATFESLNLIIYVQAKHHEGETDSWAVDQINRYKDYKNNKGIDDEFTRVAWVCSTAESFSEECRNLAKREGVRLIDGMEFARMLLDAGIIHVAR